MPFHISPRGRGTTDSPPNRFEKFSTETGDGAWEEIAAREDDFEPARPQTEILSDDSQSIITTNQSPDIGFSHSLNPYRGCEHGCAYCYARPYHEFLGYNAGLDFETKIIAKERAPELLEQQLAKASWKPVSLACSGVTDCYQPVEKSLQITRRCLEVLTNARNPVGIITKNALVTRDIDHLAELASFDASVVVLSLTSLDPDLSGQLEPRASRPDARLEAIRMLSEAGIPVGVSIAPIIPGLNDHEIPEIMQAAADHGATFASGTVIRLPFGVKDIFASWLDRFFPDRKELVLGRIRDLRGGKLNESDFGTRMTGTGPLANQIQQWITVSKRRAGMENPRKSLSTACFRRPMPGQRELF
ncbi:MAG: PA0069 family radical SAM protein [Verrucomicrobiales bacterium]|nr:PA0069 family radical SAM protein [Verrucomicrobiales bacterium]